MPAHAAPARRLYGHNARPLEEKANFARCPMNASLFGRVIVTVHSYARKVFANTCAACVSMVALDAVK